MSKTLASCRPVFRMRWRSLATFTFLPAERRFVFVANRFAWECVGNRRVGPFARVRAGTHFDDVKSAQFFNLRSDAKDAVVELLSMGFKSGEDGAGEITLDFSGGGAVRLEVESINAYMSGHIRALAHAGETET